MVKLLSISLDMNKLNRLPKEELSLMLSLGTMANELNTLTKLMYWSADSVAKGPEEVGVRTNILIFMRLLAGKLFESWRLLHAVYYEPKLNQKYGDVLDTDCKEALQDINQYFSKTNPATLIRNNFAFHFSPEQIGATPERVEQNLSLYMQDRIPSNDLFSFSEVFVENAIMKCLADHGIFKTLTDLTDDFFKLARRFSEITDCIFSAVIDANHELRSGNSIEIEMENLPKFEDIKIPWFTDTANLTRNKSTDG